MRSYYKIWASPSDGPTPNHVTSNKDATHTRAFAFKQRNKARTVSAINFLNGTISPTFVANTWYLINPADSIQCNSAGGPPTWTPNCGLGYDPGTWLVFPQPKIIYSINSLGLISHVWDVVLYSSHPAD